MAKEYIAAIVGIDDIEHVAIFRKTDADGVATIMVSANVGVTLLNKGDTSDKQRVHVQISASDVDLGIDKAVDTVRNAILVAVQNKS